MFVAAPPFRRTQLRAAIEASLCWRDVLRRLERRTGGHSTRTAQKYAALWQISTAHFDPHAGRRRAAAPRLPPLDQVRVEHSTYKRQTLKARLYEEGAQGATRVPRVRPALCPQYTQHRYCSLTCVGRAHADAKAGVQQPALRKVQRPPYDVLARELQESSFSAVGRRYGVSDNVVRKWVRWYRAEHGPTTAETR